MAGPSPQREMRKPRRPNERPTFSVLKTAPSTLMTVSQYVNNGSHILNKSHTQARVNCAR